MKYYNLKPILEKNAQWNIIFGERSNGKTYSVLKYGLENYVKHKKQLAIVRRWQDDFTGKRGQVMFDSLVSNNEVKKLTKGEWTGITYYASKWYLHRYDEEEKKIVDQQPFAYGFAVSSMEHDKSTSYPNITTILFDEFISSSGRGYLTDEFVLFCNVCSTIIRQRDDVKIILCGNTINKYNPYFSELGLKHIKDMKQGSIDVYTYGESSLRVAVEYCSPISKDGKKSDVYFAFDNPKLQMITGGKWEIEVVPKCPVKYRPKDVLFTYFILFEDEILQCEIIAQDFNLFTFIHRKTTELKDPDNDLIYSLNYDPRPNWKRKITQPTTELERRIAYFYKTDKLFFDSNESGDILRNYLKCCL